METYYYGLTIQANSQKEADEKMEKIMKMISIKEPNPCVKFTCEVLADTLEDVKRLLEKEVLKNNNNKI